MTSSLALAQYHAADALAKLYRKRAEQALAAYTSLEVDPQRFPVLNVEQPHDVPEIPAAVLLEDTKTAPETPRALAECW